MERVNLPRSSSFVEVSKVKADSGFLSSQLCIVQDNNPAYGSYFSDPGAGSGFAVSAGKELPSYYEWYNGRDEPASAAAVQPLFSSYRANASLPFASNLTGSPAPGTLRAGSESGFFKLPKPKPRRGRPPKQKAAPKHPYLTLSEI